MTYKTENPPCEQERKDCNRYHDGLCVLLCDTHFKKPCPFYKKKEEGKK